MTKHSKLLTASFLRSFVILGTISLVIHIGIYLSFPFYYIQLEGEKFNESAAVLSRYLETKQLEELPDLLESYSKSLRISVHLKEDILEKRLPLVHDLEIKEGNLTNYIVTIDKPITRGSSFSTYLIPF